MEMEAVLIHLLLCVEPDGCHGNEWSNGCRLMRRCNAAGEGTPCPVALLVDLSEPEQMEDDDSEDCPLSELLPDVSALHENTDIVLEDAAALNGDEPLEKSPQQEEDMNLSDDFIDKETFDFDMDLSPKSQTNDDCGGDDEDGDEEIFFGPVGHMERCIARAVAAASPARPLSPLKPGQWAEIVKEAHMVAAILSTKDESDPSWTGQPLQDSATASDQECKMAAPLAGSSTPKSQTSDPACFKCPSTYTKQPKGQRNASESSSSSPSKTHQRKDTFTLTEEEQKKQPLKVRRSLPIVDPPPQAKLKPSRLAAPTNSKLSSRLPMCHANASVKRPVGESSADSTNPVSSGNSAAAVSSNIPAVKRRSIPTRHKESSLRKSFGLTAATSSLPKTKIPPGKGLQMTAPAPPSITHKENVSLPAEAKLGGEQAARFSGIPAKGPSAGPAKGPAKGPLTRMQLLPPGQLQKKMLAANRAKMTANCSVKKGPLKALNPPDTSVSKELAPSIQETPLKHKNLHPRTLSNGFATPPRTKSSESSCGSGTPSSAKRRSFLPTPNKSNSSISASPASSRSRGSHQSTSSYGSTSVTDSSFDSSFLMKSRSRPIVQNTPEIPKRARSLWSPIQRPKPLSFEDEAILCTKHAKTVKY